MKKAIESTLGNTSSGDLSASQVEPRKTKAEEAFLKMQEKRKADRILEKASKSHKKRVEVSY